jgi:hypothetical protein
MRQFSEAVEDYEINSWGHQRGDRFQQRQIS